MELPITSFHWRRSRPDRHTDLEAWNKSWEQDLERFYEIAKNGTTNTQLFSPEFQRLLKSNNGGIHTFLRTVGDNQVIILQHKIRYFALPKLAIGNLEDTWRTLAPERHKEIILQAFYKAVHKSPVIEHYRKWCPEMTIHNITANEGQILFDLLNIIITKDPEAVYRDPQVVLFPNPMVEMVFQEPSFKAMGETLGQVTVTCRTYFISAVVWHILQGMFGCKQPLSPERTYKLNRKRIVNVAKSIAGHDFARQISRGYSDYKAEAQRALNACRNCEKNISALPPGTQLMACAKCKSVGRVVQYCSRACQKEDWRNGLPQPHKEICGEIVQTELEEMAPGGNSQAQQLELFSVPSASILMIPDPDPSFIRSPALRYQITLLKLNPKLDYMILGSGPGSHGGIVLPENEIRLKWRWLMLRRRAFATGDEAAVHEMFNILKDYAPDNSIPMPDVQKQFEKEYGFAPKSGQRAALFTKEETEYAEKCYSECLGEMNHSEEDSALNSVN